MVFTELYSHPYKLSNWNYTAGLRLSCGCSGEGGWEQGLAPLLMPPELLAWSCLP